MESKELKPIWPGWTTVRYLGGGGFGEVYEIRKKDDYGVYKSAVKVISIPHSPEEYRSLRADGYGEENITAYFKSQKDDVVKEFLILSEFKSTGNIVRYEEHMVVDHSEDKGWDVLIKMELLTPLKDHFYNRKISEKDIINMGSDICSALYRCAQKNVFHRDVKPENIFANEFGEYKLGDFGIAKIEDHTTKHTRIGTYDYMSPEVYNNEDVTPSADIYSLALVLYKYMNGTLPFFPDGSVVPSAAQKEEARDRRMRGEPIPPPKHGSEGLKKIVLKALNHNPLDRYQTAEEMKQALQSLMMGKVDVDENPDVDPPFDPPFPPPNPPTSGGDWTMPGPLTGAPKQAPSDSTSDKSPRKPLWHRPSPL